MRLIPFVLAALVLVGCDKEPLPADGSGSTGPRTPGPVACNCSCSGSVLMKYCGGSSSSLGDYGTPAKCSAQLASGHPGCR